MALSSDTASISASKYGVAARTDAGSSVIELIIVVTIVTIMIGFAIIAVRPHRNAYRTDDAVLRILSAMREASQRALFQRQTMRLEIDLTTNVLRIIDEEGAGAANDFVVRQEALENLADIRLDTAPTGIAQPNPPNYPAAVFVISTHPLSVGNNVWTVRFRLDGSVTNAGSDAVATGAAVTSSTLFIWPPQATTSSVTSNLQAVRAITIFGGTGATRLWKYNGTQFVAR